MSIWGTQSGNSISIPCYQETPVEDNGRGMRDHLRVCPPDGSNMEERKGVPWCCAALIAGRTRNPLKNRWRLALGTPLGIFQKYSPKIPRTFQLGWVRILPPIFPPQEESMRLWRTARYIIFTCRRWDTPKNQTPINIPLTIDLDAPIAGPECVNLQEYTKSVSKKYNLVSIVVIIL